MNERFFSLSQTAQLVSNCTAWNQPHFSPSEEFCTKSSVDMFAKGLAMTNEDRACFSNCLPDCEGTKYDKNFKVLMANEDSECSKEEVMRAAMKSINLGYDRYHSNATKSPAVKAFPNLQIALAL